MDNTFAVDRSVPGILRVGMMPPPGTSKEDARTACIPGLRDGLRLAYASFLGLTFSEFVQSGRKTPDIIFCEPIEQVTASGEKRWAVEARMVLVTAEPED